MLGNAVPKQGDFTICGYCGSTLVFGAGLRLRKPADEELRMIQGNLQYRVLQKAADEVIKAAHKPKPN
jgi:hypothetical protein